MDAAEQPKYVYKMEHLDTEGDQYPEVEETQE